MHAEEVYNEVHLDKCYGYLSLSLGKRKDGRQDMKILAGQHSESALGLL